MSTLFSPFLSSRLARPIHKHPDHNTTTDFHNASETSSFRQLTRLTASKPLPHEETSCVPAIASADFSAARTNLRPLHNLRFVLSLTSLPIATDTTAHKKLGTSNLRAIVCEQTRCPRTPLTRQQVTSSISRDSQCLSPKQLTRSLCPTFPISARPFCPA